MLDELSRNQKRSIVLLYDSIIAFLTLPLAASIRFGAFNLNQVEISEFEKAIIIVAVIKISTFLFMKLYRGVWSFSSVPDLVLIFKATTIAISGSIIAVFYLNRLDSFPRSVFIIDWFLLIFFLGGARLTYRICREKFLSRDGKKTILIGADRDAEQLIREIRRGIDNKINIVAILDNNKQQHKRSIQGVMVVGSISKLSEYINKKDIEQVIIASSSLTTKHIRDVVSICSEFNLELKILPSMRDIVGGKVQISQLREVKVEDLLGRAPVSLDIHKIGKYITDKTIMVTGAGGSIGSELCRQIMNFRPSRIVLFEICEYFLYEIEISLKEQYPNIEIIPIIGDIRNRTKVSQVISAYKPFCIFHAAAYKHVPMMESNPLEAIQNNIGGTKILAEEARSLEVPRFVMISTDKAVNPTNIMGATKRIAEMICLSNYSKEPDKTKFMIVRFGNVLGSAGSVIPRFLKQIEKHGPVTVTHPEITRYFMSIPEATQLVLQAGSIGLGGEVFVLDMGEPVKIVNLAKDLIKLSGLKPDIDIEIKFTGLRAGEKLYEELLRDDENSLPTTHEKVRVAVASKAPEDFDNILNELVSSKLYSTNNYLNLIQEVCPEYVSDKLHLETEEGSEDDSEQSNASKLAKQIH